MDNYYQIWQAGKYGNVLPAGQGCGTETDEERAERRAVDEAEWQLKTDADNYPL